MKEGIKFFKDTADRSVVLIIDDGDYHYTICDPKFIRRTCIGRNWEDGTLTEITLLEVLLMKEKIFEEEVNFTECCRYCKHSAICCESFVSNDADTIIAELMLLIKRGETA
jgi:hypothetical protein